MNYRITKNFCHFNYIHISRQKRKYFKAYNVLTLLLTQSPLRGNHQNQEKNYFSNTRMRISSRAKNNQIKTRHLLMALGIIVFSELIFQLMVKED